MLVRNRTKPTTVIAIEPYAYNLALGGGRVVWTGELAPNARPFRPRSIFSASAGAEAGSPVRIFAGQQRIVTLAADARKWETREPGATRSGNSPDLDPTERARLVAASANILYNISMPTSVHIPKALLRAVDQRARALKVSRNKFIVQALEREVTAGADWPAEFFEKIADADPELVDAVDEMSEAIKASRRSKKPVKL